MGLFVMQNFHGIILFIWIVSILTLSKSDVVKTDGTAPLTSALNATSVHTLPKNEYQTLPSSVNSTSASVVPTKTSNFQKNVATPSVAGEGGPISIPSTTQDMTSFHSPNVSKEENTQNTENRKNTKIVSRKGANEMLNSKQENVADVKVTTFNDTKLISESSSAASIPHNNEKPIDLNTNALKLNTTTLNNTLNAANITQEMLSKSTTVTASSVQEHRPKPTATVVGPNSDKRAFISHTKGLHLGMSKKINYVFPVIVTLIALPILGAIIFMIYKQGRDCWDKRHYRRMDFLIDGMYND
nr:uncharacterized protein LOC117605798 [Osmia lignaria]